MGVAGQAANVQTDRSYAVETEATQKARARYEAMTVLELRQRVRDRNLEDRQQDGHKLCVERFKPVLTAKVPRRSRVPLSELPPGLGGGLPAVGDELMAPWEGSAVAHRAAVTREHRQACCLDHEQPHSSRETVSGVEPFRLSGNPSREPGAAVLLQTLLHGVTAAFLRQSTELADGAADAMVVGTPVLYVAEAGADGIAGSVQAIDKAPPGAGAPRLQSRTHRLLPPPAKLCPMSACWATQGRGTRPATTSC